MITPMLIDKDARPAPAFLQGPKGMWIGGEEVLASSGETFETIDPTTQEVLSDISAADPTAVEQAVTAARAAYEDPPWAAITPEDRTRLLLQIVDVIEANADELATLDSLEMGGPRWLTDSPKPGTLRCDRQRELRKLKRINLGDSLAQRTAARCIRELASDIDDLNHRIHALDIEIADLLADYGNPLEDLQRAGTNLTATIIAQAGDVRRFRDASAFARFCGAAPIPAGSGQTSGRHRLHRGGNRQLNATLYRIAIVQQRHHPQAKASLAKKIAEGKTPREARRSLKRHLANVLYRRLVAWSETTLPPQKT